MEHVAIMNPQLGLLPKILSFQKRIESRWSLYKQPYWEKVKQGATIYFKNSGEPVTAKATVRQVERYTNLTPVVIDQLLKRFYAPLGLSLATLPSFYERVKQKRYLLLLFIHDVRSIEPFAITKKGFGLQAAFLSVDSIDLLLKINC